MTFNLSELILLCKFVVCGGGGDGGGGGVVSACVRARECKCTFVRVFVLGGGRVVFEVLCLLLLLFPPPPIFPSSAPTQLEITDTAVSKFAKITLKTP